MKTARLPFVIAFLAFVISGSARAQELLTTLGTTVMVNGQPHAYLLWQPQATEDTLFRRFAVYSKPGGPDGSAVFVRESIQSLQASPRTLRALLELGSQLDRDALGAARRIDAMFRDLTLRAAQAPAATNLDAAEKLAFIFQSSATDPKLLGRLFFLGRAHAGVMLALGHAFTKPMPAGVRTYEVREINDSDAAVSVLGRVTLDPATPLVLAAPGAPVAVPHKLEAGSAFTVSPKDHLNARLRWGVDDPLRASLAHTFGFDLFRVRKNVAEGLGWHLTPPAAADVLTLLAAVNPASPEPDVSSANELPILVQRPLTGEEAANGDKNTLYFADDGIRHEGQGGARIFRPFTDGESYYYFAAARDIAGRPGQLSRGTLVSFCDRLPPNAPVIRSVTGTFVPPANPQFLLQQRGEQFLKVTFSALPDSQNEGAQKYFIYRWQTPDQYLQHLGDNPEDAPNLHVIGSVPHQAGRSVLTFDDKGTDEAPTLTDKSVWYTIRAMGRTACGDAHTFSGHSSPVPGVLRDFVAPAAPEGTLLLTQNIPQADFVRSVRTGQEVGVDPIITQTRPTADFQGVSVSLSRLNPEIIAAIVSVGREVETTVGNTAVKTFIPLTTQQVLFQISNLAEIHVPLLMPSASDKKNELKVVVKAVSSIGLMSEPAVALLPGDGAFAEYAVTLFELSVQRDTAVEADAGQPIHEVANSDGSINVIRGVLVYDQPDIREWRVYRRIQPDGELSLIAKGEGDPKESPTASIPEAAWEDAAPPGVPGTVVCYYGQILDQNANPSPMFLLGCVTIASPVLPVPMLSPAVAAAGGNGRPEVNLEWFCDPVGVDRFEVLIAREGGGVPAISGLTPVPVERAGGLQETFSTHERHPGLAFYVFQTSRVGETVPGTGPRFTARLSLDADEQVQHFFAVRAVGPGPSPRSTGALSNVVTSNFVPPAVDTGVIPWPARPLPPVDANDLPEAAFGVGQGRFLAFTKLSELPFAIYGRLKPEDDENLPAPTFVLVGALQIPLAGNLKGSETSVGQQSYDKARLFFDIRLNQSDPSSSASLGKFLLYRYQLPSTAFPDARPNLVQCTPLINTVSSVLDPNNPGAVKVSDPFVSIFPIPNQPGSSVVEPVDFLATTFNNQPVVTPEHLAGATGLVCVKDPLPVIQGAKYQHLIVSLGAEDEIRRVIKINPVQH